MEPSYVPAVDIENINKARTTVKFTIDQRVVTQMARREQTYKALPYKLRPALEKVSDYVRMQMIAETFHKEGPGWKPLAKRTVRERLAQGYGGSHPILKRSGDLFQELTRKSHPHHIEVIKTGKKARIEIGGSSEKFIKNQLGSRAERIPARPMIPGTGNLRIDQRHQTMITNILQKAITKELRK